MKTTLSTLYGDDKIMGDSREDLCFECFILRNKEEDDEDDFKEQEGFKEIFETYLGDGV